MAPSTMSGVETGVAPAAMSAALIGDLQLPKGAEIGINTQLYRRVLLL